MGRNGRSRKKTQKGGGQAQDQGKGNQSSQTAVLPEKLPVHEARAPETDNAVAQSEVERTSLLGQLNDAKALLADKEGQLLQKESFLAGKERELAESQVLLAAKDGQLTEREQQLAVKEASIVELTAAADNAQHAIMQARKGEDAARRELAARDAQLFQTQNDLAMLKVGMEALKGEMESLKEEHALSEKAREATEDTLTSMEHLQWDLQTKCAENDQLLACHKADQVAHDKAIQALQTALKKEQQAKAAVASKNDGRSTQAVMAENSELRATMRHMEAVGNAQLNEQRGVINRLQAELGAARRHCPQMGPFMPAAACQPMGPVMPAASCPPYMHMGPMHPTAGYPPMMPMQPTASNPPMGHMHAANMAPFLMSAPSSTGSSPISANNTVTPFNQCFGATNNPVNNFMPPPPAAYNRSSVGKPIHSGPRKTPFPQRR